MLAVPVTTLQAGHFGLVLEALLEDIVRDGGDGLQGDALEDE